MKKFSFILGVALCACASAFAYEQIGHLNPYAYNVSPQVKNGKIAVSYNLNAVADSTVIAIYCNGVEVGTQAVADNTMGLHSAVVDIQNTYAQGGTFTVGIRVYGTSYEEPTQLMCVQDGASDTTSVNYAFYHPKGVDIDVNPFSPNFGRILTNEAMQAPETGYHSSGYNRGIYAFDPTFAPIPNGNSMVFTGGINFASNYAPYRIRISEDSRIFVSDESDGAATTLYELSADLQTWTPIFEGAMDAEGVMNTTAGEYMTARNAGLDVIGKGEDLEILMLNFTNTGAGAYNGSGFYATRYHLGTATTWNTVPTSVLELNSTNDDDHTIVPVNTNCGITDDGEGGFWFKSARANVCAQRGLCHVNAQGVVDWELHATAADTAAYNIVGNGSNGGAGIRRIGDLLIAGMGRTLSGQGRMQVFEIGADATGAPELTVKYDFHVKEISTNLNDFAIDYAYNLYTVGNSNEKIVPIMLPYSGMVETPVNAEVTKEETAVENVEAAPVVNKIFRDGQVIIVKDGVEYNAIGARL